MYQLLEIIIYEGEVFVNILGLKMQNKISDYRVNPVV